MVEKEQPNHDFNKRVPCDLDPTMLKVRVMTDIHLSYEQQNMSLNDFYGCKDFVRTSVKHRRLFNLGISNCILTYDNDTINDFKDKAPDTI